MQVTQRNEQELIAYLQSFEFDRRMAEVSKVLGAGVVLTFAEMAHFLDVPFSMYVEQYARNVDKQILANRSATTKQ